MFNISPVLELLNSFQSSNFLLPAPSTWNQQNVKLMHETLIQHNYQQKKKKKKRNLRKYNKANININIYTQ